MKKFILIGILAVGAFGSLAAAGSSGDKTGSCRATVWPFSRTQPKKDLYKQIEQLDRRLLIEYYFGELTEDHPHQSVAKELGVYLAQTEYDGDRRQFFKFLASGAELDLHPANPKTLKLDEVCEIYTKIETAKQIRSDHP